ncbi:TPA: hypothetical protein DEP30_00825 [Candidatus Nomurabacteria bacterium]|nr:MAG: hypothetical protein US04_C0001G0550 [Candidatus Nomurabacteria bacterium GW2011_GWD2_36_14]KKP99349.1 MAG: hypothetical protein US08_C0001G0031 [Candidatus Nomurabacteria bacterium GW2011_GWF2_36_19]KKQ09487.1 MAG: hypothetical protein US21_C0004G0025 [Candidatus Nomurabacteria bacterium GW2011_GWB1_36_6]KKQ44863.1 MAG: hypothetical protein US64_C0004G0042 [Candidatus Nomurabacteria bacterium GW2011_GWC1_37_9]OGJ10789.1 MAG: hypothetical protein A2565_02260 [Candidatus Nomurabacteria b
MEENKIVERKVIKISKKKLIWGAVLIVIVLIIGWGVMSVVSNTFSVGSTESSVPMLPSGSSSAKMMNSNSYDYYRYPDQDASIKDTREFLKTSYSSIIKTRDVSDVVTEVKNIVKGSDGRVDEFSSSEKYGRVRFVVAKSKFDAFKDEVESITHKKLYTESISSQNLLTEKQGIEGQILDASTSLSSLTSQRDTLIASHTKAINSMNKELARINGDLAKVRANIALLKPNEINVSFNQQGASLVEQQTNQTQNINQENKNYSIQKKNLDDLISNANANLGNANKQDDKFTDNIETVNGYVSAQWISLWEMAVIFSPIHPTLVIIILIILGFIIFRKKMPKVVVE